MLYYFITRLKPLTWFGPMPISCADYLSEAKQCLSADAISDLEALSGYRALIKSKNPSDNWSGYWRSLESAARTSFLRAFARENYGLHVLIGSLLQAISEGDLIGDPGQTVRRSYGGYHPFRHRLEQALKDDSPQAFEIEVAKAQAVIMEDLASPSLFCIDRVLIYYWQLTIAERFSSFDESQGLKELALVKNLVAQRVLS